MSQSVTKLKQLLFDNEAATIAELASRLEAIAASGAASHGELLAELRRSVDELRRGGLERAEDLSRRIDAVAARVGTDDALTRTVATVIDRALIEAEETRHDDLADAVAPVVVRTVRSEIRNSRDEIVEVLYPMTGQMVRAYVASAMKDLLAEVNRRLESNAFMLRLRALTSGRTAAEIALADSQRLVVEDLLLIRRGSGELVARWPQHQGGTNNHDHVLGGVLSAINSFVSEALESDENALRQIDLGQAQVYLRASPAYLLAAKCSGTAAASIEHVIDEEFLATVGSLAATSKTTSAAPAEVDALATRLGDRLAAKYSELSQPAGGVSPLKLLGVFIGLPLAMLIAWTFYVRYETSRVMAVASEVIKNSPEIKGYPTRVAVTSRGKTVTVSGLAPSDRAQMTLGAQLSAALPGSIVDNQLVVLPGAPPDATPEIGRLREELAELQADVPRQIARRALSRADQNLAMATSELDRLEALSGSAPQTERIAIASARDESRAAARLVSESSSVLATKAPDAEAAARLATRLDSGASALVTAVRGLGGAIGSPDTRASTGEGYGASAERLASEAQRLATLAVALTQAAVVRATLPPPVAVSPPTARERLERFARENAIFFSDDTALRDPAHASQQLDALARLVLDSGALLRVVGYTDGRGTQSRNSSLSMQRANVVYGALRERGVPAAQMVVIGREASLDISPDVGPQSANRRVELEIGFNGESGR